MKYMPLISMSVIVVMLFVYYLFNDNDFKKVMRWFGELLFIASLWTIVIALWSSLANASVLSDNSVVEFDSLFMNYISMAQNLFWIIGLCSFGIGSFMIFISSDGFLKPELRLQDRFENFLLQNIKRSENAKRGWEKTLFQIEKPDDLQIIANHPFFSYA